MKKMIILLVVGLLAGCGDPDYVEPAKNYKIGIGTRDLGTQEAAIQACSITSSVITEGTGILLPGDMYIPPVLRVSATDTQIKCYRDTGSYDYVTVN